MITIIAPVHENPNILNTFTDAVLKTMQQTGEEFEIIIVDDGSGDATWNTILQKAEENKCIRGLRFSRNFGKESAIFAGLRSAKGDAVIVMDSDMQHPPEIIPSFIKCWGNGTIPIVEGIRANRGVESSLNKGIVKLFYKLLKWITGLNMEGKCDFMLLDRRIVDELISLPEKQTFFRGLTNWMGFERAIVPFDTAERVGSQSTWSLTKKFKFAMLGIVTFSSNLVYLMVIAGIISIIFSFILGIQTFGNWISGQAVEGFTTVILLQLFFGGFIVFCLGLVGIYIANIYIEVKQRPQYIISEKVDFMESR